MACPQNQKILMLATDGQSLATLALGVGGLVRWWLPSVVPCLFLAEWELIQCWLPLWPYGSQKSLLLLCLRMVASAAFSMLRLSVLCDGVCEPGVSM